MSPSKWNTVLPKDGESKLETGTFARKNVVNWQGLRIPCRQLRFNSCNPPTHPTIRRPPVLTKGWVRCECWRLVPCRRGCSGELPGSLLTPSSLCSASQLTSFYVALFFVLIQAATTDMDDGGDEDVSSCSSVASVKEEGFPGTCLCNHLHTAKGCWNRRAEYKQRLAAVLPSLRSRRLVQALLLYILLLEPQLAQESGLEKQLQGM